MLAIGSGDIISRSTEYLFRNPYAIAYGPTNSGSRRRRGLIRYASREPAHAEVWGAFDDNNNTDVQSIIRDMLKTGGFAEAAICVDMADSRPESAIGGLLAKFEGAAISKVWNISLPIANADMRYLPETRNALLRKPRYDGRTCFELTSEYGSLTSSALPRACSTVVSPMAVLSFSGISDESRDFDNPWVVAGGKRSLDSVTGGAKARWNRPMVGVRGVKVGRMCALHLERILNEMLYLENRETGRHSEYPELSGCWSKPAVSDCRSRGAYVTTCQASSFWPLVST